MDWTKVKVNYILDSDISDKLNFALVKIMCLTARLEAIPTKHQILKYMHYKTYDALALALSSPPIDLQYIINKVLIDVQEVSNTKLYWKTKKRQQREKDKDVPRDVPLTSTDRLDKIRLDKKEKKIIKEKTQLEIALDDFIVFRKKIKKPMTEKAVELLIKKLSSMSDNDNGRIAILNQSIMNSWTSVYELKKDKEQNKPKKGLDDDDYDDIIKNYDPDEGCSIDNIFKNEQDDLSLSDEQG